MAGRAEGLFPPTGAVNVASKLSLFLAEFRRRKVGRVAVVYALVGLGAIEAVDIIGNRLLFPDWAISFVVVLVLIGFPVALVLAWALEVTPSGLQLTPDLNPDGLATDPSAKWRASTWVLAGASIVVLGFLGYYVVYPNASTSGTELVESRVAVMPFENRSGGEALEQFGSITAQFITDGLTRTDAIDVVPTAVTFAFAREAGPGGTEISIDGQVRTLGEETRAGIVVRGVYYVLGDSLTVQAEIIDQEAQRVLEALSVRWPAEDPMGAVGEVSQRVMVFLALRFDPRIVEEGLEVFFGDGKLPRYDAYEAYMEASEAIFGVNQDNDEVLRLSLRAFELDSSFYPPLVNAAYAAGGRTGDSLLDIVEAHRAELSPLHRSFLDIMRSRIHGRLHDEYLASRLMADGQAGFGQGLWQHGWAALRVNRPREALEILLQADPDSYSLRGEPAYWGSLADAYHFLGRHDEELAVAMEARERFSEAASRLVDELEALVALGRVAEVLAGAEELIRLSTGSPIGDLQSLSMELRAHGHPEASKEVLRRALSWLGARPPSEMEAASRRYEKATTQYLLGDLDGAEVLFSSLADEVPGENRTAELRSLIYAPGYLGLIAARRGDRGTAEGISRELAVVEVELLRGLNTLRRARIAAVLGDRAEAIQFILESHAQGRPFDRSWHRDPAFESLQHFSPFEEFLRPKG